MDGNENIVARNNSPANALQISQPGNYVGCAVFELSYPTTGSVKLESGESYYVAYNCQADWWTGDRYSSVYLFTAP